jgi:hypothetical protein
VLKYPAPFPHLVNCEQRKFFFAWSRLGKVPQSTPRPAGRVCNYRVSARPIERVSLCVPYIDTGQSLVIAVSAGKEHRNIKVFMALTGQRWVIHNNSLHAEPLTRPVTSSVVPSPRKAPRKNSASVHFSY